MEQLPTFAIPPHHQKCFVYTDHIPPFECAATKAPPKPPATSKLTVPSNNSRSLCFSNSTRNLVTPKLSSQKSHRQKWSDDSIKLYNQYQCLGEPGGPSSDLSFDPFSPVNVSKRGPLDTQLLLAIRWMWVMSSFLWMPLSLLWNPSPINSS